MVMPMVHTLAEKILQRHTGIDNLEPGRIVTTQPERYLIHDIYTPFVLQKLKEMGFNRLAHPERAVIVLDHLLPTNRAANDPRHYRAGLELAERFSIPNLHIGEGICHTLMTECGYARPGSLVTATDSHTPTYGGGACFSPGIGFSEMASVLGTGELWLKVPEAIHIIVEGRLPSGVFAKDVILRVLGDLKSDGGTYASLEFSGEAMSSLDLSGRFTIANMAVEAGCKVALFEADKKTAEYFVLDPRELAWLRIDAEAGYCRTCQYQAEELEPLVSCPPGVDNVYPLREVAGTKIDQVYIGSCTNGSLEDLAVAAAILEGKKVAPFLRLVVIPATVAIYRQAIRLGYIETFIRAGGMVCHPCCGLCCGQPYGLMSDGEVVLGTNNRNFLGRMGTKKSLIYLSSPAVAAASAVAGVLVEPGEIGKCIWKK